MKIATIIGMGILIALVGMRSVNLIVADSTTLVSLGSITNYRIWIASLGLILIGALLHFDVAGAILVGILVTSILTWSIEKSFPHSIIQLPIMHSSVHDFVNFSNIDFMKLLPSVLAFVFIGLADVGGIVYGMASLAGVTEEDGRVPGAFYAFIACGLGTLVGAATGTFFMLVALLNVVIVTY